MKRISTAAILAIIMWGTTMVASNSFAKGGVKRYDDAGSALDDDGLRTMLNGMGYEPAKLSKGFLITVKKDTWTYYIQFVLSSDNTKLGMNSNLGMVSDPDSISASEWRRLLEENNEIDPSTFLFNKEQKKLYMHRSLDNRGVTPAFVRTQIENFTSNMHDTSEYWKFTK